MTVKKMYVLYDFRALKNTDDATVYEADENLKELKKSAVDYGGGVIYSYDIEVIKSDDGNISQNLINEKFECSIEGEE